MRSGAVARPIRSMPVAALAAAGLGLLIEGCGGSASPAATPTLGVADCTVAGQNAQVLSILRSWYYWDTTLPATVDAASYPTTDALLDALREQPLDRFTYFTTQAADQSFYGAGQYVGYGLGFGVTPGNNLLVNDVYAGSPAAQAGLSRGDTITGINGVPVPTLISEGQLDSVLGAASTGVAITFTYTDLQSHARTATLVSAVVTQPSVERVTTLDASGRTTGYILFNSFIDPSISELDQAFARFVSEGVTELVVDERYNGGGEVTVAQHLASLIAGSSFSGKTLATLTYNAQHPDQNTTIAFQSASSSLSLSRVFFITSESTASASELVINALGPYVHVVTVGGATFGKPVGEDGFNVCTNVLYPITFKIANATGYGDYFNGLPPTCPAADDATHPLGDPSESSLAAALDYVRTGRCAGAASAGARELSGTTRSWRRSLRGWRQLVNAY